MTRGAQRQKEPAPRTPALSHAQLERELRVLAEQRFEAHYIAQRTAGSLLGFLAFTLGMWGLTLIEPVGRFFKVTPSQMGAVMALEAVAITAATLAARFGGIMGKPHRVLERVETVAGAITSGALIYWSGSAATVMWFIPAVMVIHGAPDVLNATFTRAVICGATGLAALGFVLDGKLDDGLLTAFFASLLFFVARVQARSTLTHLQLLVERNLLRGQLEELRVEEERRRIARDLHDGLGAELAAFAWSASSLAQRQDAGERAQGLADQARALLAELRSVARGLSTSDMSVTELGASLETVCQKLVAPSTSCLVITSGEARVRGEVCGQLSLVVREAVRNAMSHASPSRITVSLRCDEGGLSLCVEDDGTGMPPDAQRESTGGLRYMQERTERMGGALRLQSDRSGTRIVVHLSSAAALAD